MRKSQAILFAVVATMAIATPANAAVNNADPSALAPQSVIAKVARHWIAAIDRGDAAAACRLQDRPEVDGVPCAQLAPLTRHCRDIPPGKKQGGQVALRSPREQVGRIDFKGYDETNGYQATAQILSLKKTSDFRVTLGLTVVDGQWRVSYLRHRERVFRPAGLVTSSPLLFRLQAPCGSA